MADLLPMAISNAGVAGEIRRNFTRVEDGVTDDGVFSVGHRHLPNLVEEG